MTNKDEAFNKFMRGYSFALSDDEIEIAKEAWQACKEALEFPPKAKTQQPTKEEILGKVFDAVYAQYHPKAETHKPVAWMSFPKSSQVIPMRDFHERKIFTDDVPLYPHPKEWQGLTAEEINSIPLNEHTLQAVENLLRSKNT